MKVIKINIKSLISSLFILLIVSCAQRSPLTGGEKDIIPPKVKKATPENESVNFSEKTIEVLFDEFVRLDNFQSQLIISPLMPEEPDIVLRGKKLMIKINSELKPNTTYSINFGDAIKDITEGNPYPNYKYVFSTGEFIDSLSYSGVVLDAFSLQPKEGVFVMLYDVFEDSIPLLQKPRYIAKSNKEGTFTITNISEGKYKLFALKDINSNYLFDLPNEEIAFYSDLIQIDSSSVGHKVYLFKEENELQYVVGADNPKYGKIEIEMNLEAENINVVLNDDIEIEIEEKNLNKKQKVIWLKHPVNVDATSLVVLENNNPIDTVDIDLITENNFKDSALTMNTNIKPSFDLNQTIVLFADRPIQKSNTSSIVLMEDSLVVPFQFYQDSLNTRMYHINYSFKEKTNYLLLVKPNALEDIYGLKNDTILQHFKTKKESDYGTLMLNVNPEFEENYTIQLIQKDKVIKEVFGQKNQKFTFSYLLPGDYQIKLMSDNNNDQKWTSGNYIDGLQPEKVFFYEGVITIQENWDNAIEWKIEDLH